VWDDESLIPLSHEDGRVEVRRRHALKKEYMELSVAYARDHGFEWILHLDGDEYMYLGGKTTREYLASIPPSASGVYVPWLIFGSNHLDTAEDGSVVPVYTRCAARTDRMGKTLGRVARITGVANPHQYICGDEPRASAYQDALRYTPDADTVCIAHYQIQSWDHFRRRRARNRDDTGTARRFHFSLSAPVPPASFHIESNKLEFPHVARFLQSLSKSMLTRVCSRPAKSQT
jgi:hypothetical protein